uniref:replication initiation protein n=1 Tax=Faecalibacterium prausnitzii TaxID=853 RepID=UPI003FEE3322
ENNDGIITGKFHHELKTFFLGLKEKFTQFNLMQYMQLPSIYSQKLYAFLKSWDDKPDVTVSVIELHEMLDTPESFRTNFKELRRWVLEKAHKDIVGKTQLYYEWEPIKRGRAIIAVRFIFGAERSLPVAKKKADGAREKQSQLNNAAAITAMKCLKERGETCRGGYQKKSICDICLILRP